VNSIEIVHLKSSKTDDVKTVQRQLAHNLVFKISKPCATTAILEIVNGARLYREDWRKKGKRGAEFACSDDGTVTGDAPSK
jgi:hypothetical protein